MFHRIIWTVIHVTNQEFFDDHVQDPLGFYDVTGGILDTDVSVQLCIKKCNYN